MWCEKATVLKTEYKWIFTFRSSESDIFKYSLPSVRLQIWLPVQSGGEGHVVQGARDCVHAWVLLHPLDAVLRLVRGQLPPQLLGQDVGFVSGQNPEGIDNLFCGVHVGGLAGHEVEEAVELNVTAGVGVNDGQNSLEVNLTLLVLSYAVAKRNQTVLEFLRIQATRSSKSHK